MKLKKKYVLIYLAILFALTLSACGANKATPTPSSNDPSSASAETTDANPAPTSETIFINLAGPDIGTTMEWVDGSLIVYVPAGEFIMGQGGEDNPEHTVFLRDFWIYRTKVTNKMYADCVAAGGCSAPKSSETSASYLDPENAEKPVTDVVWEQAAVYCSWVQGDLPTEAQWEKTARGPEGNIYPWGSSAPSCDLLNFDNCLGGVSNVTDFPAGKSYYEVLDMAGNTFEWVLDWYAPTYYEASPSEDPYGPELGEVKSVRSSSFESAAQQVPVANRFFIDPAKSRQDLGFRCVLIDPVTPAPFCVTVPYSEKPPADLPVCEPSNFSVGNTFCQGGSAYVNIQTDNALASVTSGGSPLNCTQYQAGRITCGPLAPESQVSITVCAPGCESDGNINNNSLLCPIGFEYNPATNACEYAPVSINPLGSSCAAGYQATALGCLPLPVVVINRCAAGYYFDTLLGTCVPNSGVNDCFQGYTGYAGEENCNTSCLDGYFYNAELGCCAPADGSYVTPGGGGTGCPDGYSFDALFGACVPSGGSGTACATFQITAAGCYEREKKDEPSGCAQYGINECGEGNACYWDTYENKCVPYGQSPG